MIEIDFDEKNKEKTKISRQGFCVIILCCIHKNKEKGCKEEYRRETYIRQSFHIIYIIIKKSKEREKKKRKFCKERSQVKDGSFFFFF
jgi:hypothetical protein